MLEPCNPSCGGCGTVGSTDASQLSQHLRHVDAMTAVNAHMVGSDERHSSAGLSANLTWSEFQMAVLTLTPHTVDELSNLALSISRPAHRLGPTALRHI